MALKSVIHVNRHNIAANKKGATLPVFSVKTYKDNRRGNKVTCHGPVQFVYTPEQPLSCGAKAYAITFGEVSVD